MAHRAQVTSASAAQSTLNPSPLTVSVVSAFLIVLSIIGLISSFLLVLPR